MNANQLASVLAVGAVFNVVYPIATAIDEAAEYEQCAYCYAGGFSGTPAPSPTPTPTATSSDDHSWFSVAPSLLSLPARYPVTGRWTDELPALQAFFRVEVEPLPAAIAIPELPARVVEVPDAKPTKVLGVWRDTLPGIVASFTGNIEDPDEPLYLMVAELMSRAEPRNYLVDRRVLEDEWLAIVAGLLSK